MVKLVIHYTLAMTAAPKPRPVPVLAADGIQDLPLTEARPQLSKLIEDARERDTITALTVRGRRRICLVTPEFVEQARAAIAAGHGQPGAQPSA